MDEDQEAGPKGVSPGGEEIFIRTNGIYQHYETGNNVLVLGIASWKGDSWKGDSGKGDSGKGDCSDTRAQVIYTNKWFISDGRVVMQSDGVLWRRDRDDFHKKFSFVRAAPLYDTKPAFDPIPAPEPFEDRFQEELRSVFVKCLKVLDERKGSYANNGMTVNDYMPFGHLSYAQMVQLKSRRIESLAAFLAFSECSDDPKKLADLKDSLLDIINYAAFYAAWLEAK